VEVDGAYFGGYVKPANECEDRKDRRKKIHQSGKRQVVIAVRKRSGATVTHVGQHEGEGVAVVAANVTRGTTVHADEASHWDRMAAHFPIKRINHKEAYSKDGACTNQAESFFSRLRRAETGTHHHIAGNTSGRMRLKWLGPKTSAVSPIALSSPWPLRQTLQPLSRRGGADTGSAARVAFA